MGAHHGQGQWGQEGAAHTQCVCVLSDEGCVGSHRTLCPVGEPPALCLVEKGDLCFCVEEMNLFCLTGKG